MLEIQVAGAGAGKTYGLAKKIIEKLKESTQHKTIFALTYTNAAKIKIESEVVKRNGSIPETISIETVHSFLLNEIIFPFSSYILGERYNKSSIIFLGDNLRFRESKIKRLKEQRVIHAEVTYTVAKQIIDKESYKNKTKKQKQKVDNITSILSQCIDSILIDEVQDLDNDALRVFEVLGSSNIFVYMIGDPKQAIKWPKDFAEFIKNAENNQSESVKVLETNNVTRRVPKSILRHSNRFCYEGQAQKSVSDEVGLVKYIESSHEEFESFMKKHISGDSIVCIDKKVGEYSTGNGFKYSFPFSIEEKIKYSNHRKDDELVVRAAYNEFCQNTIIQHKIAINTLVQNFDLTLETKEFAQLYELCKKMGQSPSKYKISSIDAVKGLEADTCVVVLTPNTYKYFIQKDLKDEQRFNKEWKKLYVALTRAVRELILVLDYKLFHEHNLEYIKGSIESLGVSRF